VRERTAREIAADEKRRETLVRRRAREREARRITRYVLGELPTELRRGYVRPVAQPFLRDAERQTAGIIAALGGDGAVSEQKLALLADAAVCGVVLRCEAMKYLADGDQVAAARVGSLASTRAKLLALVGVERIARDVADLDQLLRRNSLDVRAGDANDTEPVSETVPARDRSSARCPAPDVQDVESVDVVPADAALEHAERIA
jgi:hypothetical protein